MAEREAGERVGLNSKYISYARRRSVYNNVTVRISRLPSAPVNDSLCPFRPRTLRDVTEPFYPRPRIRRRRFGRVSSESCGSLRDQTRRAPKRIELTRSRYDYRPCVVRPVCAGTHKKSPPIVTIVFYDPKRARAVVHAHN